MAPRIVVVDYGMGNIHSILKALRLYAQDVVFTGEPSEISRADALVLPGDGAFGAAMQGLDDGRREALLACVERGVPLLGICIGFQILFEDSDEDTHGTDPCKGLGLLPGRIRRFVFSDSSVRVPHMGWNRLEYTEKTGSAVPQVEGGAYDKSSPFVYFIHSYRAQDVPDRVVLAQADYAGDRFPALVKKDHILAMQFHPEKSDRYGLSLIESWVRGL